MKLPRVVIGGTHSGAGKTTVVCAILAALKKRGMAVASFKCGPDYIDPMFHKAALDIDSYNLDIFLMGERGVKQSLQKNGGCQDICILEGVMGYYDGLGGVSAQASTYAVAQLTNTPAVLVLDCKGISLSAVAMLTGYRAFCDDSHIVGVILNRISPMFYGRMKNTIEQALPIKVLGYLPENQEFQINSRHLGLLSPHEVENYQGRLATLAEQAEKTLDLDGFIGIANDAKTFVEVPLQKYNHKNKLQIGIAKDEAFSFYYQDNLDLLSDKGCELVYFSPLHDKAIPKGLHGLMLGGGYPEVYAKELSENKSMRQSVYMAVQQQQLPTIGECGGFLYLHDTLEDIDGRFWPMTGVIHGRGFATPNLVRFGYHTLTANEDGFLKAGQCIPAHGFHYWDSSNNGSKLTAKKPLSSIQWQCGHSSQWLWAGFSHVHFYGAMAMLEGYLKACNKEVRPWSG